MASAAIHHLEPPPLSQEIAESPGSVQRVALHAGNTIVVRMIGSIEAGPDVVRMTGKLADHVRAARGQVRVFFDLEGFTRYHSEVRIRYTEALLKQSDKVDSIHVYADSRLVKMGAQVAALVLPQLHIVSRELFDRALSQALHR